MGDVVDLKLLHSNARLPKFPVPLRYMSIVKNDDGQFHASLIGGVSIGSVGDTELECADLMIGHLRDIVNERNQQLKAIPEFVLRRYGVVFP